jgi:hypothetical protein
MTGSLTLARHPSDVVKLCCEKCGHAGQYRKAKLIEPTSGCLIFAKKLRSVRELDRCTMPAVSNREAVTATNFTTRFRQQWRKHHHTHDASSACPARPHAGHRQRRPSDATCNSARRLYALRERDRHRASKMNSQDVPRLSLLLTAHRTWQRLQNFANRERSRSKKV